MSTPVQVTLVPEHVQDRSDTRRDWALIILAGGGMVMTVFAAFVLYLVHGNEKYAFYLGLAAMLQVLLVLTGLMGLLVKRTISISRTGINIGDIVGNDLIPRQEAKEAVQEAETKISGTDGSNSQPS
jgi:hypothetical protein